MGRTRRGEAGAAGRLRELEGWWEMVGAGGSRREPEGAGGSRREPEGAGGSRREPEGAGGSRREP
jgi:hypothetical protein